MNDTEIVELVSDVFCKIIGDLNDGLYKDLEGDISFRWHDNKRYFYADAATASGIDEPPKHYIGLSYDAAILLYRDIEHYYQYIEYGADNEKFDIIFKDFEYPKSLSVGSSKEHSCKNMFTSGITWILYHELGHLIQEHLYIRNLYISSNNAEIIDCAANDSGNNETLSGKASAVYHVTEMAADFYATTSCLSALLRHFEGNELEVEIRNFTSVLALLIYRFHGINSYVPTELPEGSHPKPLIRLEQTMPLVFEIYSKYDLLNEKKTSLNRLDLIRITSWSSFTVGLFWLRKNNLSGIPEDYFLSGSRQRPGMTEYHRVMLDTWDEVKPIIDRVKRIDDPFQELKFSDAYRKILQRA